MPVRDDSGCPEVSVIVSIFKLLTSCPKRLSSFTRLSHAQIKYLVKSIRLIESTGRKSKRFVLPNSVLAASF